MYFARLVYDLLIAILSFLCALFLLFLDLVWSFLRWCQWSIFYIPAVLRGQYGISLSLPVLTPICTLLHVYFIGKLISRIHLYTTTVSKDFTEWCITFNCSLGSFLHGQCSWWDCLIMHSTRVATLPATNIVLRWAIWCSRVSVIPVTWVRMIGIATIMSYFRMHGTYDLPLSLKLCFVIKLGSSDLMKFLSFVYGLWSYLVMFLCMLVLVRASDPALSPSWSCGRGTHVVPLACECADSQLWELTMCSRAHRYGNTLSWLPSGLPSGTSWLLGVFEVHASLTLLPAQHQLQSEDSCMGKDLYSCFAPLYASMVVNSLGDFFLPCIVSYFIY